MDLMAYLSVLRFNTLVQIVRNSLDPFLHLLLNELPELIEGLLVDELLFCCVMVCAVVCLEYDDHVELIRITAKEVLHSHFEKGAFLVDVTLVAEFNLGLDSHLLLEAGVDDGDEEVQENDLHHKSVAHPYEPDYPNVKPCQGQ